MDPNQPITTEPAFTAPAPSRGIFGTGMPSTIAFAVALLLFLLPFAEIKCGGTAFLNKKGIDFALNKEWNTAKSLGNDMFKDGEKKPSKNEGSAPIFILVAIALAVVGIGVSLIRSKGGATLTALTGVAGVASLVGFMIMLKSWFDTEMAKDAADKAKDATSGFGDVKLSLDFTVYLYLTIAAFLVAAIFAFLRMQNKKA
jgi:amino acid transporter